MFSTTLSTLQTLHFIHCLNPTLWGCYKLRIFLLTLFCRQHRHKKIFFSPIRALWLFPVYIFSYYVELKSKAANPRLALLSNDVSLFSSLFNCSCCFLPQKCSQFCSLEHNYSKYLSPSSRHAKTSWLSKRKFVFLKVTETRLEESTEGLNPGREMQKKERTEILCRSPKPLWCTIFKNLKGIFHGTTNLQAWRASNTQTRWCESICNSYYQKNCLAFPALSLTRSGCQLCISFPNLNHSAWNNPAGWLPGLGWVGCYYS